MNILLINPKNPDILKSTSTYVPMGLLYIGTVLKQHGKNVKVVDYCVHDKIPNNFKPDIIGISCFFSGKITETIRLCKKLKKQYGCKIILGGIHPTIFAKDILKNYRFIDYICTGEGEKLICDLSNGVNENQINGLTYRDSQNNILQNPQTYIENLDKIPFPDYGLVNYKKYHLDDTKLKSKRASQSPPFTIISSRSCPNRCNFCCMYLVHGPKWRPRSAKNVVDEIEYLHKKYSQKHFSFWDDNFVFDKRRTKEIAKEIIDRNLDITFDTPSGIAIKNLDEDTIDLLVEAGLEGVCLPIESGSEYIRNQVIKKNLKTEQIYNMFRWLKKHKNIFIRTFFVIGFPEETSETLQDTYNLIKKVSNQIDSLSIFYAVPFPNTELFNQCYENNTLLVDKKTLYKNTVYSSYNNSDIPFIKPYSLTIKEIEEQRAKMYKLVKNNY